MPAIFDGLFRVACGGRPRSIRVYETVLLRVIADRRVFSERNDSRAGVALLQGASDARRAGGGGEAAAEGVARSGFQRFPFRAGLRRDDRCTHADSRLHRKNAMLEIERSFAPFIEGMHRDDAQFAVLANEDGGRGAIKRTRGMHDWYEFLIRSTEELSIQTRRIEPAAAAGIEEPASVMIWRPAPGGGANESPAKGGIQDPLSGSERRPGIGRAERPPAVTVTTARRPTTISVKIGESWRIAVGAGVRKDRVPGGVGTIDAAGNPLIEDVVCGNTAEVDGSIVTGGHGERLAFGQRRGNFLVEDGDAAGEHVDVAAIVKIVHAKRGAGGGFDGEVAAGDAEIVVACVVDVERSAALTKDQTGDERAVIESEIIKLQDGLFAEKGHGAILEFHFGAAVIGGHDVAFADGKIGFGGLPGNGLGIGQRVASNITGETHIALHEAEANDAGVAGICGGGMNSSEKQAEKKQKDGAEVRNGHHSCRLPGTRSVHLVGRSKKVPGSMR